MDEPSATPAGGETCSFGEYPPGTEGLVCLGNDLGNAALAGQITGALLITKHSDGQLAVSWSNLSLPEAIGLAQLAGVIITKRIFT